MSQTADDFYDDNGIRKKVSFPTQEYDPAELIAVLTSEQELIGIFTSRHKADLHMEKLGWWRSGFAHHLWTTYAMSALGRRKDDLVTAYTISTKLIG